DDLAVRPLRTDTGGSNAKNAKIIRDDILEQAQRSGRKIVVISHSKGVNEVGEALAQYPELKEHVAAHIALNGAWGGSPIASFIEDHAMLRMSIDGLTRLLWRAKSAAIADLTYRARKELLRADGHAYPLEVPTVCITSQRYSLRSLLFPTEAAMALLDGVKSD